MSVSAASRASRVLGGLECKGLGIWGFRAE